MYLIWLLSDLLWEDPDVSSASASSFLLLQTLEMAAMAPVIEFQPLMWETRTEFPKTEFGPTRDCFRQLRSELESGIPLFLHLENKYFQNPTFVCSIFNKITIGTCSFWKASHSQSQAFCICDPISHRTLTSPVLRRLRFQTSHPASISYPHSASFIFTD